MQYVGQTNNLKNRIRTHKRGKKLYVDRAIRKHGWENFMVDVLEECESREQLNEREIFRIAALNTKIPNGYNLTDGGKGTSGFKHKGVPKTPEHCFHIALGQRAESPFKNLRFEMDARQMTGAALAKLLGLTQPALTNKMRGRYNFTASQAAKMEEFFGKPAEYLLARDDGLPATVSKTESYAKISVERRGFSPYKNLIAEIDKQRLTYRELSKLTGIGKSALPLKISGKVNFTADEVKKLEEIFGKPAEYLLARDDGVPTTLSKRHQTPFKNLFNAMVEQGFSYMSLAKLMGMGRQTFSNKMSGKSKFKAKEIDKLVEIFNKPAEYLLFKEES